MSKTADKILTVATTAAAVTGAGVAVAGAAMASGPMIVGGTIGIGVAAAANYTSAYIHSRSSAPILPSRPAGCKLGDK